MAIDVIMPKMGYDMTEGTLSKWLKEEGDPVTPGEAIAEVETGKVDIEIEAFDGGVLARILVAEGETVPVGTAIAVIAAPGEDVPDRPRVASAPSVQHTNGGVADAQADSGTPADSSMSGHADRPAGDSGAAAASGHAGDSGVTAARGKSPGASRPPAEPEHGVGDVAGREALRRRASPLARRLAEDHGVDLSAVRATGPHGRIVRDDVLAAIDNATAPAAIAPAHPLAADPTSRREELSRMRRTIARRLTGSWTSAPHIFVTASIDMTDLLDLRRQINSALFEDRAKVSVNDLVIKAVAASLRRDPRLNVSWSDGQVIVHDRINVGSAVALDDGLFTVVVPDADRLAIVELSRLLSDKADRARSGKLLAEDVATAGTFSVTNLGMYGVDDFTAIINPPEAAILAVGAASPTPVVRSDEVVIRSIMRATLSADHRVVDGSTAAEFLALLRETLENPVRLLV